MKTLTTFRLSDTAKDNLQEALDLLRLRDRDDGECYWRPRRSRTSVLELAIAEYLTRLKQPEKPAGKRKLARN